jgi:hypothetical protein
MTIFTSPPWKEYSVAHWIYQNRIWGWEKLGCPTTPSPELITILWIEGFVDPKVSSNLVVNKKCM